MKFLINYANGAVQWSKELDIGIAVSLLSSGVAMSVVDVEDKKALIVNMGQDSQKDIGWAPIPEFGAIPEEGRKKLEKSLG